MITIPSHLIGEDEYLNEEGVDILCALLNKLNPKHHGKAFIPIKKVAGVEVAIELVVVREGKVLLSYRDDDHFTGWHTPGTYQKQEETWSQAANRCSMYEFKLPVKIVRVCASIDNPDNLRFHDNSLLLLCGIDDDPPNLTTPEDGDPVPGDCRWFGKEDEPELIYVHKKFWKEIVKVL